MGAPKEKSTIITGFVFDFETGGLDARECAATQISIHAIRLDNFEVMETVKHYIYPYNFQDNAGKPKPKKLKSKYDEEETTLMKYEDRALEYSAITMDMLYNEGEPIKEVCADIIEFMKRNVFNVKPSCKPILIGQNPLFDVSFLQQIMIYTGFWTDLTKILRGHKDYFGNFQPYCIDTIIISQLALSHNPQVSSWSLGNLCELLGIDLDDAHDADADVIATFEVLKTLTARMRNEEVETDGSSLVETKKTKTRDHFKI